MAVSRLQIHARAPYEGGVSFGEVGAYERLDGTIHFAVDPAHAANRLIVDLDRAERDTDGRVHYTAGFCLLQPSDPARGNRRLLFDVVNRGRKTVMGIFNRAPRLAVATEQIDPGDGFLMRRGWTVAWCGWQWDVHRSAALMGIDAPQALDGGHPIQGQTIAQFQPNGRQRDQLLADRMHTPNPAAGLDDPEAVLTVRDWLDGPRTVIARDRWRFARDEDGRAVADDTSIRLEDGFEPGRIYELVYRTRVCPVVGTGLLAVRDTTAFLRRAADAAGNPCAGRVDHAFGYGVSQSGRFLRHFLYLGLNVDEAGHQVFDGLLPHVAGAHRGEFNHRFAQPSVQATRGFGQLPPFADDDRADLITGRTDGVLTRQRAAGGVPRIIYTNTSAEYWPGDCSRGDASLIHTDPAGRTDTDPPEGVRIYAFAGTQHVSGALPLTEVNALDGTHGAHPFNTVDFSPLVRAALDHLDRWVTAGVDPPPSVVPRLADGTAATVPQVLAAFRPIPGATVPDPEALPRSRAIDLGPDAERGVGRYPAIPGGSYPAYVSAVDSDGNEVAGIRLPDISVPVATYTGWNPRGSTIGGAGQIVMMLGSTLPFAATEEERRRTGDPRPSVAERYGDRDGYIARVRAAAEELAARRHILPDDIDLVVQNALDRHDAFTSAPRTQPAPV